MQISTAGTNGGVRTALVALVAVAGILFGGLPVVPPASAQETTQSIWDDSARPAVENQNDSKAVEVGVRFRASTTGAIHGIRFYKGSLNTGTHVGTLWTNTGTKLATVTFASETASGWQEALFDAPVAIEAGTTYVASYHAPNGRYSLDSGGFSGAGVTNGALTALADGQDGANGVYRYGTASTFPTNSWRSSNYWVDVLFVPAPDTTAPSVTDRKPAADATGVSTTTSVSATFSEPVDETTVDLTLESAAGPVAATAAYDAATRTATLKPSSALEVSTSYTARIQGAQDAAGNVMEPVSWSFTTSESSTPPAEEHSLWTDATTPGTASAADDSAVELGVKFRADVDGYITAIKFYKGSGNTGTHVGNLWSRTGTLLSTATFTDETSTGWQRVTLPSPVPITAGTTYVASYHAPNGRYAFNSSFFTSAVTSGPLRGLADGEDGGNGVYRYGGTGFPTSSYRSGNYWVDVVFTTDATDTTEPTVASTSPSDGATGVAVAVTPTATFSESVDPDSIAFTLEGPSGAVAGSVSYDSASRTATFTPSNSLPANTAHTARVSGATDQAGLMMSPVTWSFTTAAPPPPPPSEGPGGPVLLLTSSSDPFSSYYAEILRTEGLNAFTTADVSTLSASLLSAHDVAILGRASLTGAQVSTLSDWVNGGGNLIAMRPDKQLAGLLGLADASSTLEERYLKVDTTQGPGIGIVADTMQFHGTADRYTLDGATAVATLYSSATASTTNPAVTLRSVGTSGGQAAAFTYDLARSVVYTRQGNPGWDGQERDGSSPIRSNDLYFGGSSTDWVDLTKVHIPQADEQQRLLGNLIQHVNRDRKPLPRFWYFPRNDKAVVIATGDDHANGGTAGRFDRYKANSPSGCSVGDWECLRFGSYIYPHTPLSSSAATAYHNEGFEVGLHVSTGCRDWNATSLRSDYSNQLSTWTSKYTDVPAPTTNRTHCIAWSDWATQAVVSHEHGIRLDTNYYYWPGSWVQDRPGFMTGSGMPMRFAQKSGAMLDVYQASTQMTDESNQSYPETPDSLLDRALGAEGFYGAFTANMHTDQAVTFEDDQLITSALARGVPVVSGRQMLEWLDGRNASTFDSISWQGDTLSFTIEVGAGARGLTAMVPTTTDDALLVSITRGGSAVSYTTETIKGVHYAVFPAAAGSYAVSYDPVDGGSTVAQSADSQTASVLALSAPATDVTADPAEAAASADTAEPELTISNVVAEPRSDGTTVVTWHTDVPSDSTVEYGTSAATLDRTARDPRPVTEHEVVLDDVAAGATLHYRVSSRGVAGLSGRDPSAGPRSVATRPADTRAPRIRDVDVVSRPDGTTTFRWRTDEASSSRVVFGTSAGALREARVDSSLVAAHGVTATRLEPRTTYHYRVESTDASGNRAASSTASFTTPSAGVTDMTIAQLREGSTSAGGYLSETSLGEVSLAPTDGAEFSTDRLPPSWTVAQTQPGGRAAANAGALQVDGAQVVSNRRYPANLALEAAVTFRGVTSQAVGFGSADGPLAAFTTRDGQVYATTIAGSRTDTPIDGSWMDAEHRYRVERSGSAVRFFIDGTEVASHAANLSSPMTGLVSDAAPGGGVLSVSWLRPAAYARSTTFTSRVIDAYAMVSWDRAMWLADAPGGTSLQVSVRTGSVSEPDSSWSGWQALPASGAAIDAPDSRYIQYRVELSTNAADRTPVLQEISFTHDGGLPSPHEEEPG